MSGGGGSSGDSTVTNEPWKGQEPYLRDLMQQAQGMFQQGQGQEYYPGNQVAPFSPQTEYGLGQLANQGMYGTGTEQGVQNYINQSTMNPGGMAGVGSDMPGQNPYLDQMYNTVSQRAGEAFNEQAMPGINATFGGAGRTGSGIHQQVVGNAVDDFQQNMFQQGADIYGTDYNNAMNRDVERRGLMGDMAYRGASMAPQFQGMQQNNIDQMLRGGAMQEDQGQRMIDAEMNKWNFGQQAPWQALNQYGGVVNQMPAYAQQETQGGGGNTRLQGAAGGAMAGSTFGPWGTAIGGGLGYMMG
jgi:hypothetical protein